MADSSKTEVPPDFSDERGLNVLLDRRLDLHPSPEDAVLSAASTSTGLHKPSEPEPTESSPLLPERIGRRRGDRSRSASVRRKLSWRDRPHPLWVLPGTFLVYLAMGSLTTVEFEIYTQLACREVDLRDYHARAPFPFIGAAATRARFAEPTKILNSDAISSAAFWTALQSTPTLSFQDMRINETPEQRSKRCRQSAPVEKLATTYMTTILMILGILSALTTAAWSTLSDRIGRKPSLMAGMLADIFAMTAFILIMTWPLQFGFKFLAATYTLGGIFGGPISAATLTSAYISDCTRDGSRANIFSAFEGIRYAGIALGPLAGAFAVRFTGILLFPIYGMLFVRVTFLLLLIFVIPESLSLSRRRDEQIRLQEEGSARAAADATRPPTTFLARAVKHSTQHISGIIAPLKVLVPKEPGLEEEDHQPMLPREGLPPGRRDWNLTWVAASYLILVSIPGITPVKIQFARFKYDWGPSEVALFVTTLSTAKLFFLLLVLPFGIQKLRKATPLPPRPRPDATLDSDSAGLEMMLEAQREWDREAATLKVASDSSFDLTLARSSVFAAFVAHVIMSIPSSTPAPILIGALITALSSGSVPALQSLALSLSSPRDAGRVLGSLSVLGSISLLVIAPSMFGLIFVLSIEWFPELLFISASVWFLLAFVPSLAIRLGRAKSEVVGNEEGL
ncbi:hypothetical protein P7C70_g2230, partial [Phenoliferia sp. Uapishka_3]